MQTVDGRLHSAAAEKTVHGKRAKSSNILYMCALLDAINALRCTEYQSAAQLVDCGLFVRKIDSSRRDICLRWPLATVAAAWRSVPSSSVALHRQLDSQQRNDIWIWKIGFVHEPFKDFKQFNCIQCMFFLSSYFFFSFFSCIIVLLILPSDCESQSSIVSGHICYCVQPVLALCFSSTLLCYTVYSLKNIFARLKIYFWVRI